MTADTIAMMRARATALSDASTAALLRKSAGPGDVLAELAVSLMSSASVMQLMAMVAPDGAPPLRAYAKALPPLIERMIVAYRSVYGPLGPLPQEALDLPLIASPRTLLALLAAVLDGLRRRLPPDQAVQGAVDEILALIEKTRAAIPAPTV